MTPSLLFSLVLAGEPSAAQADPFPADAGPPATEVVGDGKDAVVAPPLPSRERIADINRVWRGVGIGYANGLFGQGFGQSLRVDVPFGRKVGQFFALRAEGRFIHPPPNTPSPYDPAVTTGLMLIGRGPVWGGLFRVYGGAGAWLGIRPNPDVQGKDFGVAGGGFFGTEVLVTRRMSFTFEVGGQGPSHIGRKDDAGASVMGGLMVYLGALGKRARD